MGWLADLSTAWGIPIGGAAAAAALYRAGFAIEKEARKEAIADIANILKSPSWSYGSRPSQFIGRLFNYTFGDRQLSLKCLIRSFVASFVFLVSIVLISLVMDGPKMHETTDGRYCSLYADLYAIFFVNGCDRPIPAEDLPNLVLFMSLLPDYLAIAKARVIINLISRVRTILSIVLLVLSDVAISCIISFIAILLNLCFSEMGGLISAIGLGLFWSTLFMAYQSFALLLAEVTGNGHGWAMFELFVGSTILTSIWTILILVSSIVAKLILPLDSIRQFATWFFDVDRHPIRAISAVAGGLVFAGSMVVWMI